MKPFELRGSGGSVVVSMVSSHRGSPQFVVQFETEEARQATLLLKGADLETLVEHCNALLRSDRRR